MKKIKYLTIALAKGRLADRVMEVFEAIGISCDEMKDRTFRKLISINEGLGVCFFLAKANGVSIYVGYGAADIGAVSRDTILREGHKLHRVMDLGMGKCRTCICGPESARERLEHHELVRVATKYPSTAKDYFYNQRYQTMEIIELNGPIELALIVGLSEVIMDTVETGSTLQESGFMMLKEVYSLSARIVVNQVSMKTENERVTAIIKKLQAYLKRSAGR